MLITETLWSNHAPLPLLAALQGLPLLAVPALLTLHRVGFRLAIVPASILFAFLELLLVLYLYHSYDATLGTMQFAEYVPLLGPLQYHAAIDGISVLFLLLNALLTLLVSIYIYARDLRPFTTHYSALFLIQASTASLLVTVDILWFALMSVVELGLIGYILKRWAVSADHDRALSSYLSYMGIGLASLMAAVLLLGWSYASATGEWSFDLLDLSRYRIPASTQALIFVFLFFGLGIRTPLFPMHGWLATVARHGNIALGPVLLLGLKVGVYGMIRFLLPLLPETVGAWHQYVVNLAVIGIFYAAFLAFMQANIRHLLAFAVISHTGIIMIGLFSLGRAGFTGAVLLSVTFGLATSGLLFMIGFIHSRTDTLLFSKLGGLIEPLPIIGATFLIAGLSIVGMPPTPGFDAAHLVLESAMSQSGALVTIAAALGNVVAAAFLLWAFQKAFMTPRADGRTSVVARANRAETTVAVMLIVVLLGAGFYSDPWLELIESSLRPLDHLYQPYLLSGESG